MVGSLVGKFGSCGMLFLRTVVAWSPGYLALAMLILEQFPGATAGGRDMTLPLAAWVLPPTLLFAGAMYAVAHPGRGIQDRIAGTWLVPK